MFFALACVDPDVAATPTDGAEDDSADVDSDADSGVDSDSDSAVDSGSGVDSDSGVDSADTARDTAVTAPPTPGPCDTYASAVTMGTVDDPALDELSGLAVSTLNPGILWTHEDSGGAAELYALDYTGATVATVTLEGVTNADWEDLALAPCGDTWCLAIGEIGTASYDHSVLTFVEPLLTEAAVTVVPEVWPFTYPGDSEDAEGLALTTDGTAVVVTKRLDATAGVYTLAPGAAELVWQGDVVTGAEGEELPASATAADLYGDALIIRTYLHLWVADMADLTVPPTSLAFALELQGEAVAWDPIQGGFWQVAEGSGARLFYTGCE